MNEELKPCPFCGGKVRILVSDDEGNIHDEDYEYDPWSGLGYQLAHTVKDASSDCPIATEDGYEVTIGFCIYDSREEATEVWNKRC